MQAAPLRFPARLLRAVPNLAVGFVTIIGAALLLLGSAVVGLGRVLVRSDRFTRRQTVETLDRGILRPLPLVGLLSILLGAILGLTIASAFAVAHVERVLLPLLRTILVRHAVPAVIGIHVVGEGGLWLVARLCALRASGEADTMRTLGISPANWVLPQALLGFFLLASVQFLWAGFVAQLAAALVLLARDGVPVSHYVDILGGASARADAWAGFARCEATALMAWMVAATTGTMASGTLDQTAHATRITFLVSLLGILAIAAVFTWAGA
jgi:phospholipid/cholesterol/gamma-HCH transport system permease protein